MLFPCWTQSLLRCIIGWKRITVPGGPAKGAVSDPRDAAMHGDFWDGLDLILWGALLAIVMVIGIYILKRIRGESIQKEPIASELMTNLREIHAGWAQRDRIPKH